MNFEDSDGYPGARTSMGKAYMSAVLTAEEQIEVIQRRLDQVDTNLARIDALWAEADRVTGEVKGAPWWRRRRLSREIRRAGILAAQASALLKENDALLAANDRDFEEMRDGYEDHPV